MSQNIIVHNFSFKNRILIFFYKNSRFFLQTMIPSCITVCLILTSSYTNIKFLLTFYLFLKFQEKILIKLIFDFFKQIYFLLATAGNLVSPNRL